MVMRIKLFFKNELRSFVNYIQTNWTNLLLSLTIGIFLFWLFDLLQEVIPEWANKIVLYRPPLFYFLIFEWLLLIIVLKWMISLWYRYRNTYFLKKPTFSWVDVILTSTSLPIYRLVQDFSLLSSSYFIAIAGSLGVFIIATYIFAMISVIKTNLKENKKGFTDNQKVLLADDPITEEDQDLIGRRKFVNALKENIYNISFEKSFVMALYGCWGEGKTSILNLLKQDIKNDGNVLVYDFGPWFFGNEDALTINFYHGLEDLLQERYFLPRKIKSFLKFYPEVLVKGFAGLSFQFHKSEAEDRPSELKKKIEEFVSSLDRRILVIIDDIDRLQKNEILAVFRLIKLTSHMRNMVFLLSFDPSKVASAIKNDEEMSDPRNYIEKIVQLPIHLPMTDQRKIDQFLLFSYPDIGYRSEIDKFFDQLGITGDRRKEFDDAFVKIYQSDLKQIFSTYRAAKRYLNSVFFRLPFIEREVYLYDFFIIEIFQAFFPEIYSDIKSSPWYYVSSWTWEAKGSSLSLLPYDENEKYQVIKKHIEDLISNEKDKGLIISLLQDVFPEVKNAFGRSRANYDGLAEDYQRKKRVAHPDCFLKYFMLGVREGIISDAEFEDMLKKWKESSSPNDEIKASFFDKYQKEVKLIDLLQRLKLHAGLIDKNLILPLIRVIYQNCSKFRREGDFWNTEYDQADGVIFRLLEDNKAIQNNQIQDILKEIVEKTECLDFVSMVVLTCNKERGGSLYRVYENVKSDELKEILAKRLKEHFVDGKNNIFEEYRQEREFAFILYQWATNWGDQSKPRRDEVTDYLIEVFNKNPKNAGFFLRHFAKKGLGFDEKKYFDYKEFIVAYNPEKFTQCLTKLGEKAYSTESEKEAIELFLKKHTEATTKKDTGAQQNG